MADKIVSWGGFDSKGTSGMGVTGSFSVLGNNIIQSGSLFFTTSSFTTNTRIYRERDGSNEGLIFRSAGTSGGYASKFQFLTGINGTDTGANVLTLTGANTGTSYNAHFGSPSGSNFMTGTALVGISTYSTSSDSLWIFNNFNITNPRSYIKFSNVGFGAGFPAIGTYIRHQGIAYNYGGHSLVFGVNNNSGATNETDILTVNLTGLGVRTNSPSATIHVVGSGATSSTTSFLVQNANASGSLSVKDDGSVGIGTASPFSSGLTVANPAYSGYGRMYMNANNTLIISDNNTGGNITFGPSNRIFINTTQLAISNGYISIGNGIAITANSYPYGSTFTLNNYFANNIGASTGLTISSNYVRNGAGGPNTGTAVRITDTNINTSAGVTNAITMLTIDPSVNTTGGATTLRGIYYNPAMSSSVGLTQHTAIETTTGSVIFNGGNVGIGISTPSSSLHISGASAVLTLTPQSPLPSGVPTGSFAVSSSVPPKPYFYDGTAWNALY
jgi:hypothetical protein